MSGPGALRAVTFPVVLSAPSGAGKTTIARRLRARRDDVVFSVSATTRAPRRGEVEGRDYHFVSSDEFRRMIAAGELLEWAEVHGYLYGTPRENLARARARSEYLLLDIDVQGARQVRAAAPEAVHVFVLPPSGHVLAERLLRRASEAPAARARRLANARAEVLTAAEFDYVIVNDALDAAVAAVDALIRAESLRATRMPALAGALDALCAQIERHVPVVSTGNIEPTIQENR